MQSLRWCLEHCKGFSAYIRFYFKETNSNLRPCFFFDRVAQTLLFRQNEVRDREGIRKKIPAVGQHVQHLHHPVTRAPVDITWCRGVSCRPAVSVHPAEKRWNLGRAAHLGHLDRRLLVDTEQGNVGHADEGPLLVGPEHDDRSSLWSLSRNVKIGEANTTQIWSQTNEDVPVRAYRVRINNNSWKI